MARHCGHRLYIDSHTHTHTPDDTMPLSWWKRFLSEQLNYSFLGVASASTSTAAAADDDFFYYSLLFLLNVPIKWKLQMWPLMYVKHTHTQFHTIRKKSQCAVNLLEFLCCKWVQVFFFIDVDVVVVVVITFFGLFYYCNWLFKKLTSNKCKRFCFCFFQLVKAVDFAFALLTAFVNAMNSQYYIAHWKMDCVMVSKWISNVVYIYVREETASRRKHNRLMCVCVMSLVDCNYTLTDNGMKMTTITTTTIMTVTMLAPSMMAKQACIARTYTQVNKHQQK